MLADIAATARALSSHPWGRFALDCAARTGTSTERYGDIGQWAALAYLMTGDAKWAATAADKLISGLAGDLSTNRVREYLTEYALLYGFVRDALTADEDAACRAGLDRWCRWVCAMDTPQYTGGFALTDSDRTVGQWFGLHLCDLLLGSDWRSLRAAAGARDAVQRYCAASAGGVWCESSDYNLGTLKLLLMGAFACGIENYPEVAALVPDLARAQLADLTPDYKACFQWGDEEEPRSLTITRRVPLLAMLAGLTGDPECHAAIAALTAGMEVEDYFRSGWRAMYFYRPPGNPAPFPPPPAPQPDPEPEPAPVPTHLFVSSGNGHFRYKRDDVLVGVHAPNRLDLQHEVGYVLDFQWYAGGWVLTRPLGYGSSAVSAAAGNSPLFAGLSAMRDRWPWRWAELPDGFRVETWTGGPYYPPAYYDPPPAFLTGHTRYLRYTHPGRVEVVDSFDGADPRTLPKFDRYKAADRALIEAAPALWQVVYHCPAEPTETAAGYEWVTPHGVRVRLTAPTNARRLVMREADVLLAAQFKASELAGYQVRFLSDEPTVELRSAVELVPA